MRLKFTKMHGLGNDFVVLDATRAPLRALRAAATSVYYGRVKAGRYR